MEDHARYGELIYAHKNDDLYVNLFIASELRWAAKGLTLRQETRFPDEDRTTLTFRLDHPARLTLKLRWPGWVAPGRMAVRVNGVPAPELASAGARLVRGADAPPGRPATPWRSTCRRP